LGADKTVVINRVIEAFSDHSKPRPMAPGIGHPLASQVSPNP